MALEQKGINLDPEISCNYCRADSPTSPLVAHHSSVANRPLDPWKDSFVHFIEGMEWHWFVTIPVGGCPDDYEVLRRLRIIEAKLCAKYVSRAYSKLPHAERYLIAVAFEGDRQCGTRHAHILVRVPQPKRKPVSNSMVISLFPWEFRFEWSLFNEARSTLMRIGGRTDLEFGRIATAARKIYAVKNVQKREVNWSHFEFVTPPKSGKFNNENRHVIRNRDRQKRRALHIT
jgi:hypothetical protein